jgi:hypothetical protein
MSDIYAVAVAVESNNGAVDVKLRTVDAVSREEAIGKGYEYYNDLDLTIHKVTAIRVVAGQDADAPYIEELRNGRKIAAIKMYREDTGVGLREAKEYIDNLERIHGSAARHRR